MSTKRKSWRCFHCDEVFTREAAALEHFGRTIYNKPLCQVTRSDYDDIMHRLERYQNEDTDLHRLIHKMESDHHLAKQRAEESGYAKGLRDGRQLSATNTTP